MIKLDFNKLHRYLTEKLDLNFQQSWTWSHINKYQKSWKNHFITVPIKHWGLKDNIINITIMSKNIAKYLDNDVSEYLKYKKEIIDFISNN